MLHFQESMQIIYYTYAVDDFYVALCGSLHNTLKGTSASIRTSEILLNPFV